MNQSTELFIKVSHLIVENPKIIVLSCEARWAFIEGLVYSSRNMTDGLLDRRIVARNWSDSIVKELTTNDDVNPSWQLLDNGDVQIHGFCEWQMTTEKRAEIKAKRSQAGVRSGAVRRANKTRTSVQQVFEQNVNKNELEIEAEREIEAETESKPMRISSDWKPNQATLDWAKEFVPSLNPETQAVRFVNYWLGEGAEKANWDAVFKNWCLRTVQRGESDQPAARTWTHHPPEDDWMYPKPEDFARMDQINAEMKAREQEQTQ